MSRLLPRLPRHLVAKPQFTRSSLTTTMQRPYSSSSSSSPPSSFGPGPSPPRLPPEEQAEFERLQREAAVSSAFHSDPAQPASSSPAAPASTPRHTTSTSPQAQQQQQQQHQQQNKEADPDPNQGGVFRGAPPEFEGDVNPRTGEVGGPKNEPLRWGEKGDWSYNGRVTDF